MAVHAELVPLEHNRAESFLIAAPLPAQEAQSTESAKRTVREEVVMVNIVLRSTFATHRPARNGQNQLSSARSQQ